MSFQVQVTLLYDVENCGTIPLSMPEDVGVTLSPESSTSCVIGRGQPSYDAAEGDDPFIRIPSDFCSQRHARLSLIIEEPTSPLLLPAEPSTARKRSRDDVSNGVRVLLKDLNSTNGTLVNMVRVREAVLENGDTVVFGGGRDLVLGEAAHSTSASALILWRVHIEVKQLERPCCTSPQIHEASVSASVEKLANWISQCSRSSLERLRDSQQLPEIVVESALIAEPPKSDPPITDLVLTASPRVTKGKAPSLSLEPPLTSTAVTIANGVAGAPLNSDITEFMEGMQPTPLRMYEAPGAHRSPSADPVAPFTGAHPNRIPYSTVRVGTAAFTPGSMNSELNGRLLSRLRRKCGVDADWVLDCNLTHVNWSMLSPSTSPDDGKQNPVTFSLPLRSVEWVGIFLPASGQVGATNETPPKRKRGAKSAVKMSVVPCSSEVAIVFSLRPKFHIPLLECSQALFPSHGSHSPAEWALFTFVGNDAAAVVSQWAVAFDASCAAKMHRHAGVRTLTLADISGLMQKQ